MTLWIYLARRDRKGIKLITHLEGKECAPHRLDLNSLKLDKPIHDAIQKVIYENRMMWEPWIQSATSFPELFYDLLERGYTLHRKCSLCVKS